MHTFIMMKISTLADAFFYFSIFTIAIDCTYNNTNNKNNNENKNI